MKEERRRKGGRGLKREISKVKDLSAGISASGNMEDKAFTSQKRTVDKVLSTLHESGSVMRQLDEMDDKRWDKEEGRW